MITVDEYLDFCDAALDGYAASSPGWATTSSTPASTTCRARTRPSRSSRTSPGWRPAGAAPSTAASCVPRDRDAEFTATGTVEEALALVEQTRAAAARGRAGGIPGRAPGRPGGTWTARPPRHPGRGAAARLRGARAAPRPARGHPRRAARAPRGNRLTVGALRQDERVSETPTDPAAQQPSDVVPDDVRHEWETLAEEARGAPVRLPRARRADDQRRRVRRADAPAQGARGRAPEPAHPRLPDPAGRRRDLLHRLHRGRPPRADAEPRQRVQPPRSSPPGPRGSSATSAAPATTSCAS